MLFRSKLEDTNISRFFGVVSSGSTIINPVNASTNLPTGITAGQFIVSVSGAYLLEGTTYVGLGTTAINGIRQDTIALSTGALGSGTVELVVLNAAANGASMYSSPSDWYKQQKLGLTNSTVYWKNIAPRPSTSEYASQRSGKNDLVHVVVVDDTGAVTGAAGNIVEKFLGLSKASDAKISPAEAIYYKDYIRDNSQYIFPGFAPSGTVSKFSTVSGVGAAKIGRAHV